MASFIGNGTMERAAHDTDLKASSLSEASDDMPEVSDYTYGISEYQILSESVNNGMIIHDYRKIFANTSRRNYDVEDTYRKFSSDMEEYRKNISRNILQLQSLRPATPHSRSAQASSIKRLESLHAIVAEHERHMRSIKETLEYLQNCEQELTRLSSQMKLPSSQ